MIITASVVVYVIIVCLLLALAIYDVRHYILPDVLNAMLALSFLLFHHLNAWQLITWPSALAGAIAGGGMLLVIRAAAQKYYGEDALGLGDVKLMTAAGLGVGFPDIMLALSIGAALGMAHGFVLGAIRKARGDKDVQFGKINVPAGLGLCMGTLIVMIMRFGFGWAA